MLFSDPHGLANMVAAAEGPSPLSYLLPTFTEGDTRAPLLQLAPWAVAAMVALLVVFSPRRRGRPAGFAAASAGVIVVVAGGAALARAPAGDSQQRATTLRGRLDLMRAFHRASTRGLRYGLSRRVSDRLLL